MLTRRGTFPGDNFMNGTLPSWVAQAAGLPIAFAQVREDPLLDQWVVEQLGRAARVLMIASGGCNAAWLASLPAVESIHLVDANPTQLALTYLKLSLLQRRSPQHRRALLGHAPMPSEERAAEVLALLQERQLAPDSLGAVDLWAAVGPDQAGRYERVFARLRECLHDHGAAVEELLQLRSPEEQQRRVAADTDLGQALDAAFDDAFELAHLIALFGAGATQNPVEPFARHFARRTRDALAAGPAADNPYLWQVLLGRYPPTVAAPWLDLPVLPRLPPITSEVAVMNAALAHAGEAYDFVHLSNILDWLTAAEASATLALAWSALRPGGAVLIRQLNSTLDIRGLHGRFTWLTDESAALHERDRSYFYRAVHLGRKA
jgi:S-adenosylmethionine-diacylglycerol 3-amino-3-carboxypropyl transferase